VEGLLTEVRDALQRTRFTTLGDSAVARERGQWADFYSRLEACIQGETPFTLVLRDPLAGCFISASTEDWTEDKQLSVEDFARDWEEDEEFGLHECVACAVLLTIACSHTLSCSMDVRERDAEGHAEPEEAAAAPIAA
jgi:ZPR1 zinc-finger domain